MRHLQIVVGVVLVGFTAATPAAEAIPAEANVAARVDQLLLQHLSAEHAEPAPLTSDEDFLRRVSLDLAGKLPTPSEATAFGLNPDPQKRAKMIDSLLASPAYGEVWSAYWKDVIYLRATEARSRISQPAFERWMSDQLNANRPWDEITRELITATGNVRDDGQTGLIFAHNGNPEELAAEVARIFCGIQLSCANCHNHPTDSWKREQFHGLAAFLPRITVRRDNSEDQRSFIVSSYTDGGRGKMAAKLNPETVFRLQDRNRNGKLSKDEARGPLAERFDAIVGRFDADKDGQLTMEELAEARTLAEQQPGRGNSEYYMPDLQNPASEGTLTQPVFFLADVQGPRLKAGADDLTRRNALADFVTTADNHWFADALVNRLWAEMLGEGFYMPIDDIGPQRTAQDADVLELLSRDFVASHYDMKRLFRTIALTQAYQRQLASTQDQGEAAAFRAASATRLRSDQVYNALTSILGSGPSRPGARARGMGAMNLPGVDPRKQQFSALFGFDPSTPQADLLGNVPQALFLMNSPVVELQTRGAGNTRLARILQEQPRDEDALDELYLLVLSRNPTPGEIEISRRYIEQSGERTEAFEDLMWSLLNSAEFLSKR